MAAGVMRDMLTLAMACVTDEQHCASRRVMSALSTYAWTTAELVERGPHTGWIHRRRRWVVLERRHPEFGYQFVAYRDNGTMAHTWWYGSRAAAYAEMRATVRLCMRRGCRWGTLPLEDQNAAAAAAEAVERGTP